MVAENDIFYVLPKPRYDGSALPFSNHHWNAQWANRHHDCSAGQLVKLAYPKPRKSLFCDVKRKCYFSCAVYCFLFMHSSWQQKGRHIDIVLISVKALVQRWSDVGPTFLRSMIPCHIQPWACQLRSHVAPKSTPLARFKPNHTGCHSIKAGVIHRVTTRDYFTDCSPVNYRFACQPDQCGRLSNRGTVTLHTCTLTWWPPTFTLKRVH